MLHEPSLLKLWHTYSGLTVKVSNFWKSKIATATILKSQKLRYLRNGLTDLYELWYADATWVS